MRGLDLLLCLKEPQIDLPGPQQNVIGILIKPKRSKSILRSVAYLIEDGLDANIGSNVPDSDNFVSS